MLKKQQEIWKTYDNKDCVDICVVDDCSISYPLSKIDDVNVYRINKKAMWNWPACRNIAAKESKQEWLLITDIDMILINSELQKLLTTLKNLDKNVVYRFKRKRFDNTQDMHQHGTTILLTKKLYWEIGGYDERLSGLYYGVTGDFNKKLKKYQIETLNVTMYWLTNKGTVSNENKCKHLRELVSRKKTGQHSVLTYDYEKI